MPILDKNTLTFFLQKLIFSFKIHMQIMKMLNGTYVKNGLHFKLKKIRKTSFTNLGSFHPF